MTGKGARLPSQSKDKTSLAARKNAEDREVLFGDFTKLDDKTPTETTLSTSQAMMASLGETKQQFIERGEKLEQLSDKSAKLADASKEFANMAKQIRQQQQQQSWW